MKKKNATITNHISYIYNNWNRKVKSSLNSITIEEEHIKKENINQKKKIYFRVIKKKLVVPDPDQCLLRRPCLYATRLILLLKHIHITHNITFLQTMWCNVNKINFDFLLTLPHLEHNEMKKKKVKWQSKNSYIRTFPMLRKYSCCFKFDLNIYCL